METNVSSADRIIEKDHVIPMHKEYAKALYELSDEEGLQAEFLGELRLLEGIIVDHPGLITLLAAPNISKRERCEVIDRAFSGRCHEYICSFMKLMCCRGYARAILPCFAEYRRLWYERSGIAVAEVRSAVALTTEEKNALHQKLEAHTGKSVEMHCTVDPSLIGGVSVTVDGQLLEGSVRSRLSTLRESLLGKTL